MSLRNKFKFKKIAEFNCKFNFFYCSRNLKSKNTNRCRKNSTYHQQNVYHTLELKTDVISHKNTWKILVIRTEYLQNLKMLDQKKFNRFALFIKSCLPESNKWLPKFNNRPKKINRFVQDWQRIHKFLYQFSAVRQSCTN